MKKTQIGQLKDRLVLQRKTASRWEDVCTCSCRITYLRGSEEVIADRLAGINRAVVRIRAGGKSGEVTPSHRFKDPHGQVFKIHSAIPSSDRRWLDVTCTIEV